MIESLKIDVNDTCKKHLSTCVFCLFLGEELLTSAAITNCDV